MARKLIRDRDEFFQVAGHYTPFIDGGGDGGVSFFVATDDQVIGRNVFARGYWDLPNLRDAVVALREATSIDPIAGRRVIEAGGNIGTTSVHMARTFGAKDVLVFEPDPVNAQLLRLNAERNGVGDVVRVAGLGVSDVAGTMMLARSPHNSGDHRTVPLGPTHPGGDLDSVEVTTVDAHCAACDVPLDEVGLLWVDVQGHEGHVLAGASSVLSRGVPLVVECTPRDLVDTDGLDKFVGAITAHYSSFTDVREPSRPGRPVGHLHEIIAKYVGDDHTELLVWR